jgi:hypothetical protein
VDCEGRKHSSLNEFVEVENTLLEYNKKLISYCGFFEENE